VRWRERVEMTDSSTTHVFLRHPPLPQMRGLCYGRRDIALAREVFAEAAAALRAMHGRDALWRLPILSSPAQRCLGLAQACASAAGGIHDVALDHRLLEMDFGDWEGQPWSSLPRPELDRWAEDVAGFRPPGGECFIDLVQRVAAALAELRRPHLIVTHAGVIRAAAHLIGAQPIVMAASLEIPHLHPMRLR
jgi:alpha-ribazole phosphatase